MTQKRAERHLMYYFRRPLADTCSFTPNKKRVKLTEQNIRQKRCEKHFGVGLGALL